MEKKFEKLNADQIKEIREKYATGQYSQKELGQKFEVSRKYIAGVVQGVVKPKPTVEQRFMSKVDSSGGEEACWNWTAAKSSNGYGTFSYNGKTVNAHKHAYEMKHNVRVPSGIQVRHSCDNAACVNTNHLSVGTPKENADDMVERDRKYMGGSNPKLNELQILEAIIFSDLTALDSKTSLHRIAKHFSVSGSTLKKYLKKDPFELQRRWLEKERASNHPSA